MLADLSTSQPSNADMEPMLLATIDLKGQFIYANPTMSGLAGCSQPAVQGKPFRVLLHPDMAPEAMSDFWQTIESGQDWMGMMKYRHPEKQYCWFQCVVTPQFVNGTVNAYLLVGVKPSLMDMAEAEQNHSRFRKGWAKDWRFVQGRAVRNAYAEGLISGHPLTVGQHLGVTVAGFALAISTVNTILAESLNLAWGMGALFVSGAAVLLWMYLHQQFVQPLREVRRSLQDIRRGDFSVCTGMTRQDEIGDMQRVLIQLGLSSMVLSTDRQQCGSLSDSTSVSGDDRDTVLRPTYFTTDRAETQDTELPSFIVSVEGDIPSQQLSDIVRAISAAMQQQAFGQRLSSWTAPSTHAALPNGTGLDPTGDQAMMNEAMALFRLCGEGSQISSLARARQAKTTAIEALTKAAGNYPIQAVPHIPKVLPPPQLRKWRNGKWDFF